MVNLLTQILATRDGGSVKRCHTMVNDIPYSVGEHSYGAASLLLLIHPEPTIDLVKAVLWHDVAERWLGDMPSPAKKSFPELKEVYERIERDMLEMLELFPDLTEKDQNWVLGVDVLDLFLWSRIQVKKGNQFMQDCVNGCANKLQVEWDNGRLPQELWEVFLRLEDSKNIRLSDLFFNNFE